ncbi:jg2665 [Pararge aegeria aegeria]|uniref:Jg2665 protein n=1 Tax=Pararge aegeria aegeria TaxID=348720 RepID=A0A8S4QRQ6_9NEOP|nr:jg2665 [Pararge aegeria aegeria]
MRCGGAARDTYNYTSENKQMKHRNCYLPIGTGVFLSGDRGSVYEAPRAPAGWAYDLKKPSGWMTTTKMPPPSVCGGTLSKRSMGITLCAAVVV